MRMIRVKGINALGKTDGCESAPVKILECLKDLKENTRKEIDFSLLDLEEIHVDNSNLEETQNLIFENAKEEFKTKDRIVFVGGDHSISFPILSAFKEVFENPFLIVFDAHADCMTPGKEPTHEEWMRKLIEEGFPAESIILVGARNIWPEEVKFLKDKGVKIIRMQSIKEDIEGVCDLLMEKARKHDALYISVDIDALDPSSAPGTGYLEHGGISSREMIYFLQRLCLLKNFTAADVVEVNPSLDVNESTVKLGARILAEMI